MVKLNRRVAVLRPSATMAAEARAIELKEAGHNVISLAAGEPDFDTPERIKEAARRALAAGVTKYTPVTGTSRIKQAICAKLKRENGLEYGPGEVMASSGGKAAAANIIATLFDEGDEVIIPTPAWVSFIAMVQLSGATPKLLRAPEENGFRLTPEQLRAAITPRTRGIILNSPCNPTGAVYHEKDLRALAQVFVDTGIWVLSDDVYEHIAYVPSAPHLFVLEPRLKQQGVVLNSLSKSYAMTGWRIGMAAGPREVIAAAGRLQGQNSGNPSSISQEAAIEALNGPQEEIPTMVAEFHKRRDYVVQRVRAVPGFSLPNVPEGAFYAFPNVSALLDCRWKGQPVGDGETLAKIILDEALVSCVGGNDFGTPEFLRVSYATSMENLREAFDRIERVTRKLLES
jgi:aspartate aminotransferase